jgi:hypothetical protein
MRHRLNHLIALSAFVLLVVASCTDSHRLSTQNATMPAQALRAGGIAYQVFVSELGKEKKADTEFAQFASSADNYDVKFGESGQAFSFTFKLRPFHGRSVKDGWSTYEVGKSGWKVSKNQTALGQYPSPDTTQK